jgi:hypothetical protein
MSSDLQIWICRHGVGISTEEAQLRKSTDLISPKSPFFSRISNSICRQPVAKTQLSHKVKPTIESLEGKVWPEPEFGSSLVLTGHALRKKPLDELTLNDHRVAFKEDVGADFLKSIVLEILKNEPAVEATYFEGDLLAAVMRSRQFRSDDAFQKEIIACAERGLPAISDTETRDEIQTIKSG